MRKKVIYLIALAVLAASCRRADRDLDNDFSHCADHTFGLYVWTDVFAQVHHISFLESGLRSLECASIMIDTTTLPHEALIDYGISGCTSSDGRARSGKIFCAFSADYLDSATIVSVQLQDYSFNGVSVSGLLQITNLGLTGGNPKFKFLIQQSLIGSQTQSHSSVWSANFTLTQTSGSGTNFTSDDSFSIAGSFSGEAANGNAYNGTISSNLTYLFSCGSIVSGISRLNPDNLNPRTIDFGSGNCDTIVSAEVNGFMEEWNPEFP